MSNPRTNVVNDLLGKIAEQTKHIEMLGTDHPNVREFIIEKKRLERLLRVLCN